METKTKAENLNRELTKTEVAIISAQIIDRLTRVCKAAKEAYENRGKLLLSGDDEEVGEKDVHGYYDYFSPNCCKLEKEKYGIPDHVHLLYEEAIQMGDLSYFFPFVKYWVSGTLSEDEVAVMQFHFNSFSEIDYLWCFAEMESNYYDAGLPATVRALRAIESEEVTEQCNKTKSNEDKFMEIGTRNKKKHSGKTLLGVPTMVGAYNRKGYEKLREQMG